MVYQEVIQLITTNPGNILYHLVLAISILGTAQSAFTVWKQESFPQSQRMITGLGLLIILRLLLSIGAILSLIGLTNPHTLLPNADRAITALCLVIILWLWVYPEPMRLADGASGLLTVLILTLFILIQSWWNVNSTNADFNDTSAATGWEILSLVLLAMGLLLLIIRKPNGWGYGLGMLGTLTIGHTLQLIFPVATSDFPGFSRLFEMAGYPLLWTIPSRFNQTKDKVESKQRELGEGREISHQVGHDVLLDSSTSFKKQMPVNPLVFRDILMLIDNSTQETILEKFSKLMAEVMGADVCLVISPPDHNDQLTIKCAYNQIRKTYLPRVQIKSAGVPMLVQSMKRGRPIRFPNSNTSPDSITIGKALGLKRTGYILAAFVPSEDGQTIKLGVLLTTMIHNHRWDRDDQAFMNAIATHIAPIIESTDQIKIIKDNLQNKDETLNTIISQLEDRDQTIRKQKDVENVLQQRLSDTQHQLDIMREENLKLRNTTNNLKVALEEQSLEPQQLMEELKLTLTEIAQLRDQLDEAGVEIDLFPTDGDPQISIPIIEQGSFQQPETDFMNQDSKLIDIPSIIQDLRQPMSSIVGYSDLLLSESAGILGAVQRKFLERIQASAERMEKYLKEHYLAIPMDENEMILNPEMVDLADVIDATIAETQGQFQERGIVLRLDLLDEMPLLLADQDALQQILIHLLNNAATATPKNGEIFFHTSTYRSEEDEDYVLIQVADEGGGIKAEDLPRVFSRLYREGNYQISGIGDSGVALPIVKALVEGHRGRIWIDTEQGKGSTVTLIMPMFSGTNGHHLKQRKEDGNLEGTS